MSNKLKQQSLHLVTITLILITLVSCGQAFNILSGNYKDYKRVGSYNSPNRKVITQPTKTPKTTVINKDNGFYATIGYTNLTSEKDIILEEQPSLTTKDILNVEKSISSYTNEPEIIIQFTKEGTEKFYILTKNNTGKPIVIVIANQIVSMPIVSSEIKGGSVSISGNFTMEEIDNMMQLLKEK